MMLTNWKTTLSYNGTFTRNFFAAFHTDIAFISCKGISMDQGLSWTYEEDACVRKVMLENTRTRVLLCDHSKFGQVSTCKLFGLEHIDILVTDRHPGPQWEAFLREKNVRLICPKN
jgi:DeoR/GlpR family transcriptional regulator of sugar metabolism